MRQSMSLRLRTRNLRFIENINVMLNIQIHPNSQFWCTKSPARWSLLQLCWGCKAARSPIGSSGWSRYGGWGRHDQSGPAHRPAGPGQHFRKVRCIQTEFIPCGSFLLWFCWCRTKWKSCAAKWNERPTHRWLVLIKTHVWNTISNVLVVDIKAFSWPDLSPGESFLLLQEMFWNIHKTLFTNVLETLMPENQTFYVDFQFHHWSPHEGQQTTWRSHERNVVRETFSWSKGSVWSEAIRSQKLIPKGEAV